MWRCRRGCGTGRLAHTAVRAVGDPYMFRPVAPSGMEALPGGRDPDAHFYVAAGADCVLLCERGDAARWKNAVMFSSDEARRLGMRLMSIADQAEAEES